MAGPLKLYAVGEKDLDPNKWQSVGPFSLVLASSPDEARSLAEGYPGEVVTELDMSEPQFLIYVPEVPDQDW